MRTIFQSCFVGFILLLGFDLSGQNITINAYLKDSINQSIVGASVSLWSTDTLVAVSKVQPVKSTFSDKDGYFELSRLASGTYRLQVNAMGYVPFLRPVVLTLDTPMVKFGILSLQIKNQTIGEVVVRATKRMIDFKSDRIIYNVENDPEKHTRSLEELIQKMPMITLDMNERVQIKGQTNYKVMIDGKLSRGGSLSDILKAFPAASVKRIEVITNPGARYDAEGTAGGIINIVTGKRLLGYNANMGGSINTLNRYNQHVALTAKKGNIGILCYGSLGGSDREIGSTFIRENYFEQSLFREQREAVGRDSNFYYSGFLEVAFEPDSLNTFSFYGNAGAFNSSYKQSNKHFGFANSVEVIERGIYDDKNIQEMPNFTVGADYIRKFKKEGQEFSLLLAHKQDKKNVDVTSNRIFEFGQPDTYILQPRDQKETEQILEMNYLHPFSSQRNWALGAKIIARKFIDDYAQFFKATASDPYQIIADQTGIFDYRQKILAFYSDFEKSWEKFSIKPGLRYEYTTSLGQVNERNPVSIHSPAWFPSLSASFTLNEKQNIRAGYTRRIARPGLFYLNPQKSITNPRNTFSGNPYLGPEYNHNMEVNWGYSHNQRNLNINMDYGVTSKVINTINIPNPLDGTVNLTFLNTGQKKVLGLNLFYSDQIYRKLSISLNGRIAQVWLSGFADNTLYKNKGVVGNASLNLTQRLPKSWSIRSYTSIQIEDPTLQANNNFLYNYQFSVSKSLLKNKKLRITMTVAQPFERNQVTRETIRDPLFYIFNESIVPVRFIEVRANWSFGSLRADVSRKRGAESSDQK